MREVKLQNVKRAGGYNTRTEELISETRVRRKVRDRMTYGLWDFEIVEQSRVWSLEKAVEQNENDQRDTNIKEPHKNRITHLLETGDRVIVE